MCRPECRIFQEMLAAKSKRFEGIQPVTMRLRYFAAVVSTWAWAQSIAMAQETPPPLYNGGQPAPGIQVINDQEKFLEQLNVAIEATSRRYLTANVHTPWQIFHGILATGRNFELLQGNDQPRISAIEWIAKSNPRHAGRSWIIRTQYGATFHPYVRGLEMVFQGHPAQGLALITACELPADYTFQIDGGTVTIADMLQHTMMEVNTAEETTWVLWALNHYLKTDAQWTNKYNQAWSIEALVRNEVRSPVEGAACGGNHRLYALTKARDKFAKGGQPLTGAWFEADQKVNRYLQTAQMLQNPDGTFSSQFYARGGQATDLNSRLNTTGHTLEFVVTALPKERLNEPWVRKAVAVLSKDLIDNRRSPAEPGPLYHSLNALVIYRNRTQPITEIAAAETSPAKQAQTTLKPVIPTEPVDLKPVPLPETAVKVMPKAAGQPAAVEETPSTTNDEPASAIAPANR